MTPDQTAQLIAYIDSRLGRVAQRNPLMVEAWHEDLRHVSFPEAKAAARRLTSQPNVIVVHIGHLLADIREARRPSADELGRVLEQCERFYRDTDDCSRLPHDDDQSLAARVYRRAGGFAALHSPQWYTRRLTEAYEAVLAEDTHRALVDPDRVAITAGGMDWSQMLPARSIEG